MRVTAYGTAQRYAPLADDIVGLVEEIARSDEFILKSRVAALETEVAGRLGRAHAVACASTTGGLLLALKSLGVRSGDEVVLPAYAEWPALSAVVSAGARPVLTDVREADGVLDAWLAEAALSPATRAVVTVGASGPVRDMAGRHGLPVVELIGTRPATDTAAGEGVVQILSFRPEGLLGAVGDAAVILTDDTDAGALCRMLRNHGQDLNTRFLYHHIGYNCRMDEIGAAFLLRRLAELASLLEEQHLLAGRYAQGLRRAEDVRAVHGGVTAFADGYLVRTARRDQLREHLAAQGIETALPRPLALHRQGLAHEQLDPAGEFPVAQLFAAESLVLPLYPGLPAGVVDRVAAAAAGFGSAR
ncbi:hypothetical protein BIV23_02040 [Streptomyces monashensis]|uniref:Aminotransferase DegT n=1 Tax=Streptomyces monashensis TaxID=1678012 RepID=A0A1S2QQ93_9ACTN|nr:hypothetical protein BIV23_02040 [Streptomyces monashensis]